MVSQAATLDKPISNSSAKSSYLFNNNYQDKNSKYVNVFAGILKIEPELAKKLKITKEFLD